MIVDTSALIAIILEEPEARRFAKLISSVQRPQMSAVGYVEAALVLSGADRDEQLDPMIKLLGITLEPVTVEQAKLARDAGRRFGRGHHAAGLNFGDCFSYALAKSARKPLLFKGNDFGQTDVAIAGA